MAQLLISVALIALLILTYKWRQKMDERLALLEAALTRVQQEVNETAQEVERLKDLIGDNSEANAAIDAAIVRLHNAADALNALQPAPEPPVEPPVEQ
jgi:septal ring factor EnvC (AmiA/AmiB activator)